MAGDAITSQFNIGVATVMVGPMGEVEKLTPEQHSIGLTKAVSLTSETTEVTLTHGLRNRTVDSQVTGVESTISMEVYEYTAANIAYAAQLDGSKFVTGKTLSLTSAITGGDSATSVVVASEEDLSTQVTEGSTILLQATGAKKYDKVLAAKVSSASYVDGSLTITLADPIPTGWSFAIGDAVHMVSVIPVGADTPQPYLGVKIVGILPNGNEPVTIIIPKAKITSGMTLGFNTDAYGNMPFEITPYDLTTDDELYGKYDANVVIYRR